MATTSPRNLNFAKALRRTARPWSMGAVQALAFIFFFMPAVYWIGPVVKTLAPSPDIWTPLFDTHISVLVSQIIAELTFLGSEGGLIFGIPFWQLILSLFLFWLWANWLLASLNNFGEGLSPSQSVFREPWLFLTLIVIWSALLLGMISYFSGIAGIRGDGSQPTEYLHYTVPLLLVFGTALYLICLANRGRATLLSRILAALFYALMVQLIFVVLELGLNRNFISGNGSLLYAVFVLFAAVWLCFGLFYELMVWLLAPFFWADALPGIYRRSAAPPSQRLRQALGLLSHLEDHRQRDSGKGLIQKTLLGQLSIPSGEVLSLLDDLEGAEIIRHSGSQRRSAGARRFWSLVRPLASVRLAEVVNAVAGTAYARTEADRDFEEPPGLELIGQLEAFFLSKPLSWFWDKEDPEQKKLSTLELAPFSGDPDSTSNALIASSNPIPGSTAGPRLDPAEDVIMPWEDLEIDPDQEELSTEEALEVLRQQINKRFREEEGQAEPDTGGESKA